MFFDWFSRFVEVWLFQSDVTTLSNTTLVVFTSQCLFMQYGGSISPFVFLGGGIRRSICSSTAVSLAHAFSGARSNVSALRRIDPSGCYLFVVFPISSFGTRNSDEKNDNCDIFKRLPVA